MTEVHKIELATVYAARVYEKRIEDLEKDNAELSERCVALQTQYNTSQARHNKKRLAHYQALMNFLSQLHKQLGNVQGDLLNHIGKLNGLVMEENDKSVNASSQVIAQLIAQSLALTAKKDELPLLEE